MTRTLILFRHGKSSWDEPLPPDFERPLKKRGKRDTSAMGQWLAANHMVPDMVLSSTAKRALQTARRVCKAMDFERSRIVLHEDLYEAGIMQLTGRIRNVPSRVQRVMVVGHNPGLEDLAAYLHRGELTVPQDGKLIPTATAAVFEIQCNWLNLDRNCAELIRIQRPRCLPETP